MPWAVAGETRKSVGDALALGDDRAVHVTISRRRSSGSHGLRIGYADIRHVQRIERLHAARRRRAGGCGDSYGTSQRADSHKSDARTSSSHATTSLPNLAQTERRPRRRV
jgi:hypothetical protein